MLSKDDRRALIIFGGDIERARRILEATELKSLRRILERE
jgi:hypothetical protein